MNVLKKYWKKIIEISKPILVDREKERNLDNSKSNLKDQEKLMKELKDKH